MFVIRLILKPSLWMLCNNYSDKEVVSLVPLIKLNSVSKFCFRSFTNEQLSERAQCKIGNNKIKVIGNVKVRKLRHSLSWTAHYLWNTCSTYDKQTEDRHVSMNLTYPYHTHVAHKIHNVYWQLKDYRAQPEKASVFWLLPFSYHMKIIDNNL